MTSEPTSKMPKQWADTPFPILETPRKRRQTRDLAKESGAVAFATEMCLVHNTFIRILNSIYLQAPNVSPQNTSDVGDFGTFIYAFVSTLREHHTTEEEHAFPWLEEMNPEVKKYMDKNVEQHHLFEPGLKKLEEYAIALRGGKEVYDGKKVVALIDAFSGNLIQHLTEEVEVFERLEALEIDWAGFGKKTQKLAVDKANTEFGIPSFLSNIDITFEDGWHGKTWPPAVPWFAPYIFRWVFLPKHKGAWRFSCCDWYGKPKRLEFV